MTVDWIARVHPIVVHFPIALIAMAGAFELLVVWRRQPPEPGLICLGLGLLSGLVAVGTGWINAGLVAATGAEAELVERHRWLAVATLGVTAVALLLGWWRHVGRGPKGSTWYRTGLILAVGLVTVAGHHGGTIVHGPLFVDPPKAAAGGGTQSESEGPAPVAFASEILPIYEKSCFRCHGPKRAKGELRLDIANPTERRFTAPGSAATSRLLEVISLPEDHEDHMPKKRASLGEAEIALLRRWIDAGAVR